MRELEDLLQNWAGQPNLRASVVSWRWFEPASRAALELAAARHALVVQVNDDALCRSFFDWVRDVESHQDLEALDPLDFRHAMAGLLLQHLWAAQSLAPGQAPLLSVHADGNGATADAPARLITSLALTLLQALRLHAHAATCALDTRLAQYWSSYLENAAQEPASAICFLDRMTGLSPQWQTPTLLHERPAMLAAKASAGKLARS